MKEDDEDRDAALEIEAVEPTEGETLAGDVVAADSFQVDDELFDAFGAPAPIRYVMDQGLPTAKPDESGAYCPPLTEKEFVCIADESEFVKRGPRGVIDARWKPDQVERQPDGTWLALTPPYEQSDRYEACFGSVTEGHLERTVEPLRPQCAHYLEQLDPPGPGETMLRYGWKRRYCTFRRTVAGAFLELSHGAIRGCSARTPRDAESDALMRQMDVEKIEQGKNRTLLPLFPEWPPRAASRDS